MRYFFDVREGTSTAVDENGLEIDGEEAAKELAMKTLGEILSGRPFQERVVAIDIRNEAGVQVTVEAMIRVQKS